MAKEIPWEKRPLMSRIASILYPDHCDAETRKQMQEICDASGEEKSPSRDLRRRSDEVTGRTMRPNMEQ